MKKLYTILIAAGSAGSVIAQTTDRYSDSNLGRWTADFNIIGGGTMLNLTTGTPNYLNPVNMNLSKPTFSNGTMLGGDVQLGFFFGEKKHWGIGTGFLYMRQMGDLKMGDFHTEYQSTDFQGHTFRQIVSANSFKESINTDNFNVPLVLKYKNRFSKRWGFAADGGALINVGTTSTYKTNASFDYEAIYQIGHNADGSLNYTYDPAAIPADRDWLITKSQFTKNNPEGNVQDYFNGLRSQGYNVGLGVAPTRNTGTVKCKAGNVGFMLQPSVNYLFSDDVALNLGLLYAYQPATRTDVTYRLTNNTGDYSSVLNSVTRSETHSFGLNAGVRVFFGKPKDSDHDGIPDKKDKCPEVWGLPQFQGCPDRDGDGIIDMNDACPDVPGLVQFNGCPDTDGDGIPDKDDRCPTQAGPVQFHGCPDTDGDGIPDIDDLCPTTPGLAEFHGCPDTDGDGVPDNTDKCPTVAGPASNQGCPLDTMKITTWHGDMVNTVSISEPILFELNKATIHRVSFAVLERAADAMKSNPDMRIVIDGHADITGPVAFNNTLSLKRAKAVRSYLIKLGADPKRLQAIGHGSRIPAASNKTREGRAKNRRAVMREKK